MSLKWPAILVLLIIALSIGTWLLSRRPRKRTERAFIAETDTLKKLRSYKKIAGRKRILSRLEALFLALLILSLAIIAARPVRKLQKIDEEKSRDVVLCLDGSGSMSGAIVPALEIMKKVVEENPYESYAITVFQSQSYTAIPLTRDTVAINQTIDDMIKGYIAKEISLDDGSEIDAFNAYDMIGFTVGGGGTDIGAGLIGCIKRFGNLEESKSRHLIVLSDMEHNGAVDPLQAAQLIPRYDINMYAVVPYLKYSPSKSFTDELAKISNASVHEFTEPDTVRQVLADIYASALNRNEVRVLTSVDNPYPYWLLVLVFGWGWIGIGVLRRRLS